MLSVGTFSFANNPRSRSLTTPTANTTDLITELVIPIHELPISALNNEPHYHHASSTAPIAAAVRSNTVPLALMSSAMDPRNGFFQGFRGQWRNDLRGRLPSLAPLNLQQSMSDVDVTRDCRFQLNARTGGIVSFDPALLHDEQTLSTSAASAATITSSGRTSDQLAS